MDIQCLKDMITVIRAEQKRRSSLLEENDPNIAYDQWVFNDIPFLNELCLMLLVTLRHQVERELVGLAAQANNDGKVINGQQYYEIMKELRILNKQGKNTGWKWEKIKKRLKLESFEKYKFTEALRHIVNSYKHDPSMKPNEELLDILHLETGVNYGSLPEIGELHVRLAEYIGLEKDADFCDIAERFIVIVSEFMEEVENPIKLSNIDWGNVSLNPTEYAR